jgi:hypothetical protein
MRKSQVLEMLDAEVDRILGNLAELANTFREAA